MATRPGLWWWSAKEYWATQIDGKRICLAKGRKNKKVAQEKLDTLLAERKLLATVDGPITVAGLCEEFLDDVQRHLAPKTYESYRYACQMFVDEFGALAAHTIKPLHIRNFTITLEKRLNPTSQGIALRSVQRCFNWGVEQQIIPTHSLGKIRKPTSIRRDRYLTDDEFQAMLRATNPKNNHRRGAEFRRLLLAMDWTFCRPGELIRLKWTDIHWEQNIALLAQHKTRRATGRPKVIPLVPKMLRLLKWLKRPLQLVANFAYFLHRRKLSRIIHCKCGACRSDEYEWSYDKELGRSIVKFKCGRKYYVVKGELREIELNEKVDESEVTDKET